MAIRPRGLSPAITGGQGPFTFLQAPYGHFYADPFIVEQGDRAFLFLEDYDYLARSASLVCSEVSRSCRVLETRSIVRTPYHVSYPHVFSCDGTYYMIPETAAANRIELYRAVEFPWEWKLEKILVSGQKLHDPTHAVIDGKHWLFAGASSTGASGHYDQLHIFHSPSIHEDFRPHRGNPVKVDLASTRPAGGVIADGDRLIRPAQDCSRWYGCGLHFMRIEEITESAYSERRMFSFPDAWAQRNHLGTHTFNTSEHFEVIDICTYGIEFPAILGRALSLAGKVFPRAVQGTTTPSAGESGESDLTRTQPVSIP